MRSPRCAGLGVHPPMLQGLLAAGAEVDGNVGIAVGGRTAFARDGSRTTYLFTDFSRIAIVPSRRSNHDGSKSSNPFKLVEAGD